MSKIKYNNIPLYEPLLGKQEKSYVLDCLNTNWISSKGKYVKLFEDKFKKLLKLNMLFQCVMELQLFMLHY